MSFGNKPQAITIKGNYFKVNVTNKIIKMRVNIVPKIPEGKQAMHYRILFHIYWYGYFSPTSIDS